MIKTAILGGSGYTALELLKILLRHPHAEVVAVTSRQEGTPRVAESHPSLAGRTDLRMEPFDVDALLARGVQCAFGCLPHGASMAALPRLLDRGVRVIDLSADYRLRDPNVYAQWYGASHDDLAHLAQAVYGLPEVYGEEIATAQLVANPELLPADGDPRACPARGRQPHRLLRHRRGQQERRVRRRSHPETELHFPECNESVSAYSAGSHRHTPEIEQALSDVAGGPVEVIFTPHLIPMDRGIFSTIYATPRRAMSAAELLDLYREYYRKAPFVRVVEHLPATKYTAGTNFLDVHVRVVRNRIVVLACEDLVRAPAASRCRTLTACTCFDERTGLW
ncbi:MAG: Asd/ArgC dimerization domain-containing protein [Gemmataceae bacterium]